MSLSAYIDITPNPPLLQGSSKPLTFTLLDDSGNGVAGEQSGITLYIVEPSGSITIPGASLTDNGDGTYTYVHEFDESGWHYIDFYYVSGTTKIRPGARINIMPRETAAAQ